MGSWFFPRLGATALFICMIGSWANPALSQQTLHVETTVTDIASRGFTFGPVSATCDPANGGPGCSFLNFEFTGNCITTEETRAVVPRRCTISGTPSILLSFSSAGMHDSSGNPTGVCAPFFESLVTTYSDGSTITANGQGLRRPVLLRRLRTTFRDPGKHNHYWRYGSLCREQGQRA